MTDVLDVVQLSNVNNQMNAAQLLLDVGDSAMLFNTSLTETVWIGNNPALTPTYANAIEIAPLGYLVITAVKQPIYGVVATNTVVNLNVIPGGISFFTPQLNATITGPVAITGNVDATITGGTVGISGTVTAVISGTPNVTISGTPVVDVNSGSITINNANVDVVGVGGSFPPGLLAAVFASANTNIAAGVTTVLNSSHLNVTSYASIVLANLGISTNSTAAGAAVCAIFQLTWYDASGVVLATDVLSTVCGSSAIWEIPVKGAQLDIAIQNCGTVGTLLCGPNIILIDGSYRLIPNIRAANNIHQVNTGPVFTGLTQASGIAPVQGNINGWVLGMLEAFPATALTYIGILSLWAGPVSGWFWVTPTALSAPWTIVDLTYMVQGQAIGSNTYTDGIVFCGAATVGTAPAPVSFNLPPTQCAVAFKTPATAGNFQLQLVGVPE